MAARGAWGSGVMNPHPTLTTGEIATMLDYIFTLKPKARPEPQTTPATAKLLRVARPGFGAALAGVHPSYDLRTLATPDFRPKVGAMAFLPDGRLLVTTWDAVGGVYLLDNVTGKTGLPVRVKRIATGLAEPLGIEVRERENLCPPKTGTHPTH